MARPGRELAIAQGPQLMPEGLLADRHLELVSQPLDQVDDPPAHDAVGGGDRPRRDDLIQRAAVSVMEDRLRARRLAGRQACRPLRVEAQHPPERRRRARTICRVTPPTTVASLRLPPSRIVAIASNRRTCAPSLQRRAKPRTSPALKSPRSLIGTDIANLPQFAMVNQQKPTRENPSESDSTGFGINCA